MKKLIFILMVGSLFMGCASLTPSMLRPPDKPISNKIKPLTIGLEGENVFRSESVKTVTVQTHFATIFSRTIEQNICELGRERWGYIDTRIVYNRMKINPINLIHLLNFGFFPIFGFPLLFNHTTEVEFTIYDSKKQVIKKYPILQESDFWDYYTTARPNFDKYYIKNIENFHSILRKLENKLNTDASYINSELEKAGKIN